MNHTSGNDKDCEHVNKEYKGECFTCKAIADDISPEARKNLKAYVDKFAKSEPPISTIEERIQEIITGLWASGVYDQAVEDGAIQRTSLEVVNNYGEQTTWNPQIVGRNE